MKITAIDPPREFTVGVTDVRIKHCANIELAPDELVTFLMPDGSEHDFAAKSWGFYSTPSTNSRLRDQGFKTALVRNAQGKLFVNAVHRDRLDEFHRYVDAENSEVVEWLDERG